MNFFDLISTSIILPDIEGKERGRMRIREEGGGGGRNIFSPLNHHLENSSAYVIPRNSQ